MLGYLEVGRGEKGTSSGSIYQRSPPRVPGVRPFDLGLLQHTFQAGIGDEGGAAQPVVQPAGDQTDKGPKGIRLVEGDDAVDVTGLLRSLPGPLDVSETVPSGWFSLGPSGHPTDRHPAAAGNPDFVENVRADEAHGMTT